jgi:hypothetical protein
VSAKGRISDRVRVAGQTPVGDDLPAVTGVRVASREMIERIARILGRRPLILEVPVTLRLSYWLRPVTWVQRHANPFSTRRGRRSRDYGRAANR